MKDLNNIYGNQRGIDNTFTKSVRLLYLCIRISVPDMNTSATLRLLDNIILAFNINGVYNIDWFNTMATEKNIINSSSIDNLKKYFTI